MYLPIPKIIVFFSFGRFYIVKLITSKLPSPRKTAYGDLKLSVGLRSHLCYLKRKVNFGKLTLTASMNHEIKSSAD